MSTPKPYPAQSNLAVVPGICPVHLTALGSLSHAISRREVVHLDCLQRRFASAMSCLAPAIKNTGLGSLLA
ncbi:hypothetical protein LZ554_000666 [Drepanopeziza brunnea f. sp. 'monogermtubi']|nr:hypothetical protein LZ554_000666 [Drepanopeziza brunnea f. sp. 'monogermtubi']